MNFKLGDTLICVDNDVAENELTVGKEYKVVKEWPDYGIINYRIINDKGHQAGYFKYRFKLKEEKCLNSNKELLDWALENIKEWTVNHTYLIRYVGEDGRISMVYSNGPLSKNLSGLVDEQGGRRLVINKEKTQVITKQEWLDAKKEKEDMSNEFNLEDLKTGMKLTMSDPWYSSYPEYIVLLNTDNGDVLVNTEANSWNSLSGIKIYGNILKVEVPDCPFNLIGVTPKYKTIWERQVKSEQDTEKENLQKVIDKLHQDLQNAQQQLDNLGGK